MGGACGTYGGDERYLQCLVGKPEWRRPLGKPHNIFVGPVFNYRRIQFTHFHPVPRLRMFGAIPLLPLNVPSQLGQRQLHFYRYISRNFGAKHFPLYILHSRREEKIFYTLCVCVCVCVCVRCELERGGFPKFTV